MKYTYPVAFDFTHLSGTNLLGPVYAVPHSLVTTSVLTVNGIA
jgi:hypothetical protein